MSLSYHRSLYEYFTFSLVPSLSSLGPPSDPEALAAARQAIKEFINFLKKPQTQQNDEKATDFVLSAFLTELSRFLLLHFSSFSFSCRPHAALALSLLENLVKQFPLTLKPLMQNGLSVFLSSLFRSFPLRRLSSSSFPLYLAALRFLVLVQKRAGAGNQKIQDSAKQENNNEIETTHVKHAASDRISTPFKKNPFLWRKSRLSLLAERLLRLVAWSAGELGKQTGDEAPDVKLINFLSAALDSLLELVKSALKYEKNTKSYQISRLLSNKLKNIGPTLLGAANAILACRALAPRHRRELLILCVQLAAKFSALPSLLSFLNSADDQPAFLHFIFQAEPIVSDDVRALNAVVFCVRNFARHAAFLPALYQFFRQRSPESPGNFPTTAVDSLFLTPLLPHLEPYNPKQPIFSLSLQSLWSLRFFHRSRRLEQKNQAPPLLDWQRHGLEFCTQRVHLGDLEEAAGQLLDDLESRHIQVRADEEKLGGLEETLEALEQLEVGKEKTIEANMEDLALDIEIAGQQDELDGEAVDGNNAGGFDELLNAEPVEDGEGEEDSEGSESDGEETKSPTVEEKSAPPEETTNLCFSPVDVLAVSPANSGDSEDSSDFNLSDYRPELLDFQDSAVRQQLETWRKQVIQAPLEHARPFIVPDCSLLRSSMFDCFSPDAAPPAPPNPSACQAFAQQKNIAHSILRGLISDQFDCNFPCAVVYDRILLEQQANSGLAPSEVFPPAEIPGAPPCLSFESRFECGNLCRAVRVGPAAYELYLDNDLNTSGFTQWFFFRIRGALPGVEYSFQIVNFEKRHSAFNRGLRISQYSEYRAEVAGIGWERSEEITGISYFPNCALKMPKRSLIRQARHSERSSESFLKTVRGDQEKFHETLKDALERESAHRMEENGGTEEKQEVGEDSSFHGLSPNSVYSPSHFSTLRFQFIPRYADDTVFLAHFAPFPVSHQRSRLNFLENSCDPGILFIRQPFSRTVGGNLCELITITQKPTSSDDLPISSRPVIFISARVHSGETPASWTFDGILTALVSQDRLELRRRAVLKIVPILNPDGVINGNYRTNLCGIDMNRIWDLAEKPAARKLAPVIAKTKKFLVQLKKSGAEVHLALDMHGHSNKTNHVLYACKSDSPPLPSRLPAEFFPHLLELNCPEFLQVRECTFTVNQAKSGSFRVSVWRALGFDQVYTLESTYQGSEFGPHQGNHYSLGQYHSMGEGIARAMEDLITRNDNWQEAWRRCVKQPESTSVELSKPTETTVTETSS